RHRPDFQGWFRHGADHALKLQRLQWRAGTITCMGAARRVVIRRRLPVRHCARGGNTKAATIACALLATLATSSAACATKVQATAPWLDQLVARFQAEAVARPPRRILRYRYRGQTVYYVPPSCCDQPGILYD